MKTENQKVIEAMKFEHKPVKINGQVFTTKEELHKYILNEVDTKDNYFYKIEQVGDREYVLSVYDRAESAEIVKDATEVRSEISEKITKTYTWEEYKIHNDSYVRNREEFEDIEDAQEYDVDNYVEKYEKFDDIGEAVNGRGYDEVDGAYATLSGQNSGDNGIFEEEDDEYEQ